MGKKEGEMKNLRILIKKIEERSLALLWFLVLVIGTVIGFAGFVALAIAFPIIMSGPQHSFVTETPAEPTPVPTPEIDRFDFSLEYPEGVPSQGIDITIEGDLLSLLNTSLSANNTEISAGQPGNYHIDPSKIRDDHVNITISSLSRISKSFLHAKFGDTDYYTFTVLPD